MKPRSWGRTRGWFEKRREKQRVWQIGQDPLSAEDRKVRMRGRKSGGGSGSPLPFFSYQTQRILPPAAAEDAAENMPYGKETGDCGFANLKKTKALESGNRVPPCPILYLPP